MTQFWNTDRHLYECLFLDPKGHVVGRTASRKETQLMDEVITGAFRHRASSVVLSHHHPLKAYTSPSNGKKSSHEVVTRGELALVNNLRYQLGIIGVELRDYTIIADQVISISELPII